MTTLHSPTAMFPVCSGFSDIWSINDRFIGCKLQKFVVFFDSFTDTNYFTHVHDQKQSKLEPVFSAHVFMFNIILDPYMNFMHETTTFIPVLVI